MTTRSWMIYGAYGYSGQLIAERARERGLTPVLAGRDSIKTRELAEKLGFDWRAFSLDNPQVIADNLNDVDAVIHCAGPFSATSAPMVVACLKAGTHYFDITGEIEVFEHAHSDRIDAAAKESGIVICPGVGFDVVPTDCLAKALVEALPDATHLDLGFHGSMSVSPGTAKTIVETLGYGTFARRNGKLVNIPLEIRDIDYGKGSRQSMSVSWGDVSTAFYTTGIENITVYWPANNSMIRQIRFSRLLQPFLRLRSVQNFIKGQIEKRVAGPSQETRDRQQVHVWGEVRNTRGQSVSARITTANGYTVTQLAPVAIIEHLLQHHVAVGSTTPALLMGKNFASRLAGSSEITGTELRNSG